MISILIALQRMLNVRANCSINIAPRCFVIAERSVFSIHIGIIEGGTAINKVPALTTIYLDFRICDSASEYPIIRQLTDEAMKDFDASYEIINDVPSFVNNGERVGWYEEISGRKAETGNGITEASFFQGDRIIIGPGPMCAHQFNEHVTEDSLNKSAEIYLAAIKKECL